MKRKPAQGKKYDGGKIRLDLVPPSLLSAVGRVLTFGAAKYGDHNWQKGIAHSRLYAAAQRHMVAYWSGKDIDEESGLLALDHTLCDLAMLRELIVTRPDLDDRSFVQKKGRTVRTKRDSKHGSKHTRTSS